MARVPDIAFRDRQLVPIWEKVKCGEPLSREEGLACLQTHDLLALGRMANFVKEEKSKNYVFFVLNRQINPTNLCVLSCKFCDFAAKPGEAHAYEMTLEEILNKVTDELREVHIVGGLHPTWRFEHYLEMMRAIKTKCPTVQLKAFTAVEVDFFAKMSKLTLEQTLRKLLDAGLDTLPGGGAEVFSPRVRKELFKQKIGEQRWFEVHRVAHRMGIRSNATLLYGHIETYEERVDHLLKLRAVQAETGGFLTFIPLAFQPGTTGIVQRQTSALEDLRTLATSRLILENFPHIKSYWVMLGEETASVGLHFGADDLDGTIGEEKIAHLALASSPVGLTRQALLEMIKEAGKIPVERDALYNILKVYNGTADSQNSLPQR